MDALPILSLKELSNISNSREVNHEHQRLYECCIKHGFFLLKDHGIPSNLIQQTIDVSRDFFRLPEAVKQQYGQEHQKVYPKTARGYVPIYGEVVEEGKGPDPKEVFDLGLERPVSDKPFTGPTLMPDDSVVPGFATSHYQLQADVMSKVVPSVLKALGLILNFEANWFETYFDDPIVLQRVLLYPPNCGSIGKHKDNAIFTVLIQEYFSTPSLRIYTQGKWIDVPCLKDTLVINLGNLLQIWTNGLVVSTPHEVMHTLPTSRISIPFFISPKVGSIIKPRGTDKKVNSTDVILSYYRSMWVDKVGAIKAEDLVKL